MGRPLMTELVELFTLLLSWLEFVRLLRFFELTQFMLPLLNMLYFGIKYFFVVLLVYVIMMACMIIILRGNDYQGVLDAYLASYQLSYGLFGDNYEHYENFFQVFGVGFLALILANILISFMGTAYTSAGGNKSGSQLCTREKLAMIKDL